MTLKELSQLYYLNREIEMDQHRLDELRAKAESAAPPPLGVPHSQTVESKIERYVADIVDLMAIIAATAQAAGSRMLSNVKVRGYIDQRLAEIHDGKTADAKEVMEYLTTVLRGESAAEIVVVEGDGDGCSTARRMKKAPDEKERLKAAELLGKRYGIFTEKLKVDGAVPVVIRDDLV